MVGSGGSAPVMDASSSGAGGNPAKTDASSSSAADAVAPTGPMAKPGCGFPLAAFCDTFDAPSANKGRAGELDVSKWSAGRMKPQGPTGGGLAIGISKATVSGCRAGLRAEVFPDGDTLVCDPSPSIASNHLLVAVGAQNYGQNSYRIRQPFDFAGRTGKISFDAEAYVISGLLGYISVAVTQDPMSIPSYGAGAKGTSNDEGAIIPRNGFEVVMQNTCGGWFPPPVVGMRMFNVFHDSVPTYTTPPDPPVCVSTAEGKLNHFEIEVAEDKVTVSASPVSADGKTFGALKQLYTAAVKLGFSRGYVIISVHNHATIKYSHDNGFGATHPYDSWIARWDNVGFDGPVIDETREYEAPDSLTMGMDNAQPVTNVGYRVADSAMGPSGSLKFHGVDLDGVKSARLALSTWYLNSPFDAVSKFVLHYRWNGGMWRDRPVNAEEIATLTSGNNQGAIAQTIDLVLSDLKSGDNTLEFTTTNVPQNYPPAVANVDLVLSLK
jgi:hypothetical protein